MKKIFYLCLAAAIGTVSVACSDDDNEAPAGVAVTSVTLDKQILEMTVGDKQQLTATVAPDNADDKTVVWSSDAPEIVEVDANGLVTAIAAGEATVTAAASGKVATCKVTVTAPEKPRALVKTLRIPGDIDGFYTQIDLVRAEDGKVTSVRREQHTPQGTQGEALEASVSYEAGKVSVAYQEWGENYVIEYRLDADGYASRADKFYEGEEDGGCVFAYGSNGMVEKITATAYGETFDVFAATFGSDRNWATVLVDPESEEMSVCKASSVGNDAGLDLNMFMLFYGQYVGEVDYAILCGLLPATANLLESVDAYGFEAETDADGAITAVELKMGGEALKYTFGY